MRNDLAALSPEALASLSSRGLLKRAQRMVETGLGPTKIEEAEDVVTARFADGTTTALAPDQTLAQARCSCGAVFACRHGLAVVLAYQKREGGGATEEAVRWDPGTVDEKEVRKLIGSLGRARANRLMRGGIVVKCDYEPHPTARLPTCTLQFLVPNDLTHARCDCELGTACEHLLIAVRAFKQAGGVEDATVELAATGEVDLEATDEATELAHEVIWQGMSNAPEALDARFERVRQKLDADGQVWPISLVGELEEALGWYRSRSARYRPALAEAAAELEARCRAARGDALPVGMVLGTAEAAETRLAELRLMSLGARVRSEGSTAITQVFLVDADTGNVLVYRFEVTAKARRNQKTPPSAPTAAQLATREVVKGVRLVDLAGGQLLTQTAARRPSRELVLTKATGTQVVREPGDWSTLGPPIVIETIAELAERARKRPPVLLRPRVLAEDVHVLKVQEAQGVRWSPGEQALVGTLVLASGESVHLERRHRAAAPNAISALAAALADEPQWVSGEVRFTEAGMLVSPTAVRTAERLVVPDLEVEADVELALGGAHAPATPLGATIDDAAGALDEGAHRGLLAASEAWGQRVAESAARLEAHGLGRIGAAMRAAGESAMKARVGGRKAAPEASARWMDARIALVLARELVSL